MSDHLYRLWAAGRCPCCQGDLSDWCHPSTWEITDPEPVAEGVILCGRCIANEHHLAPLGFLEALLEAIASRNDEVIDRRMQPGAWINCVPARSA